MRLRPEEPAVERWAVQSIDDLVATLLGPRAVAARAVIAIDGRSSSGKTTLAAHITVAVPDAAVVHTDDIAWFHSRFGWDDLLVDGVLEPFLDGRGVDFRPPAWDAGDRAGAVRVPAGTRLLVVEGIGSSRPSLRPLLAGTVWVQSDEDVMAARNAARVATGETTTQGHADWLAEEVPFLAAERPWARATVIVAGTSDLRHDPDREVVVAV